MRKSCSAKRPHASGALPAGLADDQKLVRKGTRPLLEQHADFLILGEAADGAEAVRLARVLLPGIGIMHVRLQLGCFSNGSNIGYIPLLTAKPRVDFVEPGFQLRSSSIHFRSECCFRFLVGLTVLGA